MPYEKVYSRRPGATNVAEAMLEDGRSSAAPLPQIIAGTGYPSGHLHFLKFFIVVELNRARPKFELSYKAANDSGVFNCRLAWERTKL